MGHFSTPAGFSNSERVLLVDNSGSLTSYTVKAGTLGVNGFLIVDLEISNLDVPGYTIKLGGITLFSFSQVGPWNERIEIMIFNRNSSQNQYAVFFRIPSVGSVASGANAFSVDSTVDQSLSVTHAGQLKSFAVRSASLG